MSCPNSEAPKCCSPKEDKKKTSVSVEPIVCKLPETATFQCPSDDCAPPPKPFCPEKKKDECVCPGPATGCESAQEKPEDKKAC